MTDDDKLKLAYHAKKINELYAQEVEAKRNLRKWAREARSNFNHNRGFYAWLRKQGMDPEELKYLLKN